MSFSLGYKDYYKILGLKKTCTDSEIKKSFRTLARKYHPDVTKNNKYLEDKFKDICEAYEVLSDKEKRSKYDEVMSSPKKRGVTARLPEEKIKGKDSNKFSDFFQSLFGTVKTNTVNKLRKINDVERKVEINLEESISGTKREISFYFDEDCHKCNGEGILNHRECKACLGRGNIKQTKSVTAKIPPGVINGSRLTLKGYGAGTGSLKGNLYLKVFIKTHKHFEIIDTFDINCDLPISLTEAVLGTEVEVPIIKGSVKMKIPEGTQHEQTFRLKNKGLFDRKNNKFGDQYVKIKVIIPTKLSKKERELYTDLSRVELINPRKNYYF